MRKNIYHFIIGLIFLCMLHLGHQPFLAKTLSNKELVVFSISNFFKEYSINGELNINLTSLSIEEDLLLYIDGQIKENKKEIKLFKDNINFSYYEDLELICIMTPFNNMKKYVIHKSEETNEWIDSHVFIKELLEKSKIYVEKNIPININQKGLYEVKILTDCYTIKIGPSLLKRFFEEQLKKEIKVIHDINIKLYIDEELKIRLVTIEFGTEEIEIQVKVFINRLKKEKEIKCPNISDAVILKGTLEKTILEFLVE